MDTGTRSQPTSQPHTKRQKKTPAPPKSTGLKGVRHYKGKYKVEVMVKGLRASGTAETLEEAALLRNSLTEQLNAQYSGTPLPPEAPLPGASSKGRESAKAWTLKDATDATFRYIWRDTADESKQRIRAAHLMQFFGEDEPIANITTEKVDEFREWAEMELENCPNTINKKVCALSRILRTALERGKLDRIPKMPQAKVRNGRIRYLTQAEEAKVLQSFALLTGKDHTDAFITLIDTGFRLGELWVLESSNISFQANTITLWDGTTKNGMARTVPMTARVKEVMQRRCEKYPSGALWPGKNNWWFQGRWNKVRTALGKDSEKDWVTHMLRHTCCSRLVQAGVNLFIVKQWMGHKSLEITNRYAHLAPQQLTDAKNALENSFTPREDKS